MSFDGEDTAENRLERERMVREQIVKRGISTRSIIEAMMRVPRHLFVPPERRGEAYADRPLPLGPDQTISQPYIVAYMLEAARLKPGSRVLEIGTGSGYQTALLAALGLDVYSIEIDPFLMRGAEEKLRSLGFGSVHLNVGDGAEGWPDAAPFDAIIVGAAAAVVPRELVRQLGVGGRLVLPVGADKQELVLFEQTESGLTSKHLCGVKFVPLKPLA